MRHEYDNTNRLRIDPGPPTTIRSPIAVSGLSGTVREVVVGLDIDHTWTADLIVTLIAPNNRRVTLVSGRGSSGDHFRDTVFDDAATQPVDGARAPFRGRFRPEEALTGFDDIDPNGDWVLEIRDRASQDGGWLNRWALSIDTCCYDFENRIPVHIDNGPPNAVESRIEIVSLPGLLIDSVQVSVDIRHTWDGDLDITLVSPSGTRVNLARRRGSRGDDFDQTRFDDAADTGIGAGSAPFAGVFRPEEALSALAGERAAGIWTLAITDNANQDGGVLESWSLSVTTRNAEPPTATRFSIDLQFRGGLTPNQRAVFQLAAARWSAVIVGDLPAATVNGERIDDVRIEAEGTDIDGRGSILGQAGPTRLRPRSNLPVTGIMEFDAADLDVMEADGSLEDVIVHEMGHVLGSGTIWSNLGLLQGGGTVNPVFVGANAMREYATLIGASDPTPVPVANTGGPGTRDGHWREAVMGSELMTGFLSGARNPLSRVTVAAFEDMGYEVDYASADAYQLPTALMLAAMGVGAEPLDHAGHGVMFFPRQEVLPYDAVDDADP